MSLLTLKPTDKQGVLNLLLFAAWVVPYFGPGETIEYWEAGERAQLETIERDRES